MFRVHQPDVTLLDVRLAGSDGVSALNTIRQDQRARNLLALEQSWLPPTVNLTMPDPACDLDSVTGCGRPVATEAILSNSSGFGGVNASLVFGRHVA